MLLHRTQIPKRHLYPLHRFCQIMSNEAPLPGIDPRRQATPKYADRPSDPKAHHYNLKSWFGARFRNPWTSCRDMSFWDFPKILRDIDRSQATIPDVLPFKVYKKEEMDWERINRPKTDNFQLTWYVAFHRMLFMAKAKRDAN